MRSQMRHSLLALLAGTVGAVSGGSLAAATATASPAPPILLVGGTFAENSSLAPAADWLRARGDQVWTMQLSGPLPGTAAISRSADAIGARVERIRAETGAPKVALVGHSQGALAVREYVRFHGGFDSTAAAVSLGGPHYGDITAYGCIFFAGCYDMTFGSPFLKALNSGDPTPDGGPRWVHLYSTDATWEKRELEGAENVPLQSLCPGRKLTHIEEWHDQAMLELIDAAVHGAPLTTSCPTERI
jgi:pimeloyl-ACP methyl ester carboxylesterase